MKKFILIITISMTFSSFSFADSQTSGITGDELIAKKTGIRTDSLGLATGLYFIYEGVTELRKKKGKDVGRGLTHAALGISTALGAFTFIGKASAAERSDIVDEIKATDDYSKIVKDLGEERANEFLLDVVAGWSAEALSEKYGTKISQDEINTISTDVSSRNDPKEVDSSKSPSSTTATSSVVGQ